MNFKELEISVIEEEEEEEECPLFSEDSGVEEDGKTKRA